MSKNQKTINETNSRQNIAAAKDEKAADTTHTLLVENVSYSIGDKEIVSNVTFALHSGERIAVIGPNGSGKTTLIRLISSLISPTHGRILVDGRAMKRVDGRVVNVVFQDADAQLLTASVWDEIAFALRYQMDEREAARRVNLVMETFGISHLKGRVPVTLSSGEKRRVTLAAVAAMEPLFVAMDEPDNTLDYVGLCALKRSIRSMNSGVIIATHDIPFAKSVAPKVLILRHGKVTFYGKWDEADKVIASYRKDICRE